MFGLSYLSREKKQLLTKLQNKLTHTTVPRERVAVEVDIQQVLSEAKHYLDCDNNEALELREQLISQIRTLEGIGKTVSAESFRMYLRDIDFYIQTLTMKKALQEESRPVHGNEPPHGSEERLPSVNSLIRAKQKKKAMGKPRWTVDMDEDNKEDAD